MDWHPGDQVISSLVWQNGTDQANDDTQQTPSNGHCSRLEKIKILLAQYTSDYHQMWSWELHIIVGVDLLKLIFIYYSPWDNTCSSCITTIYQ